MKAKLLVVSLAALAAGLWFVHRAAKQTDQARAAMATLAAEDDTLRSKMGRWEQRARAASGGRAEREKDAARKGEAGRAAGSTQVTAGHESPAAPPIAARQSSAQSKIANDPQKLAEYAKNFRESLDYFSPRAGTLGLLARAFGLSPEQIDRFKDMEVWDKLRRMDLRAAAEAQGLDLNGAAYDTLVREQNKLRAAKEAEIFGPRYEQYQEWNRAGYLRFTTQRLASTEMYPDSPITSSQVEQVTSIMAKNSQWNSKKNWDNWDFATINWNSAGPELQGVLSSSQLAMLRLVIREKEAMANYAKRLNELNAEAKTISRQPGK